MGISDYKQTCLCLRLRFVRGNQGLNLDSDYPCHKTIGIAGHCNKVLYFFHNLTKQQLKDWLTCFMMMLMMLRCKLLDIQRLMMLKRFFQDIIDLLHYTRIHFL